MATKKTVKVVDVFVDIETSDGRTYPLLLTEAMKLAILEAAKVDGKPVIEDRTEQKVIIQLN